MQKVEEYLRHAAERREMSRTASATHRQQLETMATTRQQLASIRRRQLLKGETSLAADKRDDMTR